MHALDDIDLSVDEGHLVAVMGPSGSGKSTLLTIAGSLEEPTSGEVLHRRHVAVGDVPQRQGAPPAAHDRLRLPGLQPPPRPHRRRRTSRCPSSSTASRHARRAAAGIAALEQLGLADRAEHYPDQLSGGERQRVAIARAVVGERQLLLADEPSGALDSTNGEAVMRMIRDACKRGVAAVVVTHDAHLASWADRVVFLRDGQIVDHVAPELADSLSLRPLASATDARFRRSLDEHRRPRRPSLTPAPPTAARPPVVPSSAGRGASSAGSGVSSS